MVPQFLKHNDRSDRNDHGERSEHGVTTDRIEMNRKAYQMQMDRGGINDFNMFA